MHMRTGGHQMMVTQTSKTMNFWGHFIYNIVDIDPIHQYNIFYWQVFWGRLKQQMKQPPY